VLFSVQLFADSARFAPYFDDFMKKFLWASLCAALLLTEVASGQSLDLKKMEKTLGGAIGKAYATSVRIWGFDTVSQQQASAQFSGVVVSAQGHILTAAHTVVPGNIYKVFFTDGRECLARALGRIGLTDQQNMPDVGMMKLMGAGKWPYAEMGWSGSLRKDEPCLSIAYPETLNQHLPTVRFGRITEPLNQWGFVQSSCKMEPGDSGGPLYDYMGRVVALHSRIGEAEDTNLEVPVDLYRKYWTALQQVKDYPALPSQTDVAGTDPLADKLLAVPALADLKAGFTSDAARYKEMVVRIESRLHGVPAHVLGTVLKMTKGNGSMDFAVLSKSSLIGDSPVVIAGGTREFRAVVMARDKENDLAVLGFGRSSQIGTVCKNALDARVFTDTAAARFDELGHFLLSPLFGRGPEISVLGSLGFALPRKFSIGFFGAGANFINEQIILTRMAPESPAAAAGLELGDRITGINGVEISRPEHYGAELSKYGPGDSISIQGIRKGAAYSRMAVLSLAPKTGDHPAERFAGGKSIRLDGFREVLSHDAVIRPEECGGPVFDAAGRFMGINIARFSRTSTLILPPAVICRFLLTSI